MNIERRQMNLALAKAILNEAVSGGYLSPDDVSEIEEEVLKQAETFAKAAKKEYNDGWGKDNESVKAIVSLLESSEEEPVKDPDESALMDKDAGSGSSAFSSELPLPRSREDLPKTEMPFDVSSLEDVEIRKYYGIMNYYFSMARWKLANEQAALDAAVHMKAKALRDSMNSIEKLYEGTDKPKPATVLTAEAALDEEYQLWEERARVHESNVVKAKALTEIYGENVKVLSREATIRQDEFERSR